MHDRRSVSAVSMCELAAGGCEMQSLPGTSPASDTEGLQLVPSSTLPPPPAPSSTPSLFRAKLLTTPRPRRLITRNSPPPLSPSVRCQAVSVAMAGEVAPQETCSSPLPSKSPSSCCRLKPLLPVPPVPLSAEGLKPASPCPFHVLYLLLDAPEFVPKASEQ